VVCQSNVRQIGLGLVMYADDWKGQLPPSIFLVNDPARRIFPEPEEMVPLRLRVAPVAIRPFSANRWDGLGTLFGSQYLPSAPVFYCPSHRGANPYLRFASQWGDDGGEVVANYHFRGQGPVSRNPSDRNRRTANLYLIDPAQSSLVADGVRERADYNHLVGVNFFRADLTVHWFNDYNGELNELIPLDKGDNDASIIEDIWARFDARANGGE
jgi:hypothetical protein